MRPQIAGRTRAPESVPGGAVRCVEDLSSANGTFVDGQRVKTARMRPGADLRVGKVAVPWSHEGLRTLLKSGAGARTLVLTAMRSPSFVCGACGRVGDLPAGPTPDKLTCEGCGATLRTGTRPKGDLTALSWSAFGVVAAGLGLFVYVLLARMNAAPHVSATSPAPPRAHVEHIGGHTAELIAKAFTPMDALTRNTAVKIAARSEGPFHVEQVAEVWSAVRRPWRYVNDPEGRDYFASATETIQNGYVGDCDDFAITLASMVSAIGGKARIVLMDGPNGGHAYAEACVQGEPTKVASALATAARPAARSGSTSTGTRWFRGELTTPRSGQSPCIPMEKARCSRRRARLRAHRKSAPPPRTARAPRLRRRPHPKSPGALPIFAR
jgi:hypothetical protein